jgi:FkbM family methyltransferase
MKQTTLRDGTKVWCLRSSEAVVLDHHVAGYFQHSIVIGDRDVIFDVGANIGVFSVRAVQQHPHTRVFAFEPIPAIYAVLEKNAETFGGGRLVPVNCGLSSEPGRLQFTYFPRSPALSTAHPEMWEDGTALESAVRGSVKNAPPELWWARFVPSFLVGAIARYLQWGKQEVDCPLQTVSDVMRAQQLQAIDLLKIDCEGGELDVLMGIDLEHWPHIRQVVAEVHDVDGRLEQVLQLLERGGLSEIVLDKEPGFEETALVNVYARRGAQ